MSVRVKPEVGASVVFSYLGARDAGHLAAVDGTGRRLGVATEDGEVLEFALNSAAGQFAADGRQWGARLVFEDRTGDTRVSGA